MVSYQELNVDCLLPFDIRNIRPQVLEKLKDRISKGYNLAKPLTVVKTKDGFIVADGNHRLAVLKELGIQSVPCVVYNDDDPYRLAIAGNLDEDTYAPMDLFDWLDIIRKLRDEGLTQAQIGEKLGWSVQLVSAYNVLLNKISTEVLNLARSYQKGRVDKNSTAVEFNFTEWWFRNSGLYNLSEKYQLKLMNAFIDNRCQWNNEKVRQEAEKFKQWQEYIKTAKEALVNAEDLPQVITMIENNTFKTEMQLQQKIKSLNVRAKDKLICGDCTIELEKLDDSSIDIVITDPPYGINYVSNRSQFDDHITKEGVKNDQNLDQALSLFSKTVEILNRKTKPDAHIYESLPGNPIF